MRRNRQPSSFESVSDSSVLPVPGTPSSSMWPPVMSYVMASVFTRSWPRMMVSSSARSAAKRDATSGMLCMFDPPERIVECLQNALKIFGSDFVVTVRRVDAAGEIGDAFVQRVAAQSARRRHRPRQLIVILRERLRRRHRTVVQRAE